MFQIVNNSVCIQGVGRISSEHRHTSSTPKRIGTP